MPFELKEGQGTLHRVLDKQGVESRPDYHGELVVGGVTYKLAGWIKLGRSGKWLSLNAEIPKPKAALTSTPAPTRTTSAVNIDDDIPF